MESSNSNLKGRLKGLSWSRTDGSHQDFTNANGFSSNLVVLVGDSLEDWRRNFADLCLPQLLVPFTLKSQAKELQCLDFEDRCGAGLVLHWQPVSDKETSEHESLRIAFERLSLCYFAIWRLSTEREGNAESSRRRQDSSVRC